MVTLLTVVHIVTVVLLVLVVLLQSGKGAEISASFGGSSQTVFGSSGGANFFTRFTAGLAAVFFCTSLSLTLLTNKSSKTSVFEGANLPASRAPVAPAAPAAANPAQAPAQPAAPAQK